MTDILTLYPSAVEIGSRLTSSDISEITKRRFSIRTNPAQWVGAYGLVNASNNRLSETEMHSIRSSDDYDCVDQWMAISTQALGHLAVLKHDGLLPELSYGLTGMQSDGQSDLDYAVSAVNNTLILREDTTAKILNVIPSLEAIVHAEPKNLAHTLARHIVYEREDENFGILKRSEGILKASRFITNYLPSLDTDSAAYSPETATISPAIASLAILIGRHEAWHAELKDYSAALPKKRINNKQKTYQLNKIASIRHLGRTLPTVGEMHDLLDTIVFSEIAMRTSVARDPLLSLARYGKTICDFINRKQMLQVYDYNLSGGPEQKPVTNALLAAAPFLPALLEQMIRESV